MKPLKLLIGLAIISVNLLGCSDNLRVPIWSELPEEVVSYYYEQDNHFLDFLDECEILGSNTKRNRGEEFEPSGF